PQDVALALCGAVYKQGFTENRILEFAGPGIAELPMDYRIGIDVMTTETACLSSVWETDGRVSEYLALHGRPWEYRELRISEGAYYDRMISIDLSTVEPMIALPFHPSEAYTIRELLENPGDILRETEKRAGARLGGKVKLDLVSKYRDGKLYTDQGIIAGCSGGMYDNIAEAAAILRGHSTGSGYFSLSVYPPSMPVNMELIKNGVQQSLMESGVTVKSCFCGPCFGAGDVPGNNALSIRHITRNFPNREGSKPGDGQISAVALMDARSIAATARMGGVLTPATDIDYESPPEVGRAYDKSAYISRVYFGIGRADPEAELRYGPNIAPWPEIEPLCENLLLELAAVIRDPVTTTDELIPSGETSSYRSNPMKLAEFTLSRRCPDYVSRAKAIKDKARRIKNGESVPELCEALSRVGARAENLQLGSCVFANKPGDGSAREQAASCQRVLGGGANICYEFATKRYRSNCINWGMLPFTLEKDAVFDCEAGDMVYVPGIRRAVESGADAVDAFIIPADGRKGCTPLRLCMAGLTAEDRETILYGCLMNRYAAQSEV
ncbi:MAG: hydratase, partial [Oscillospiraceae bacterium]|nr:hydratase [Oscillospiraceae bacterium]